MTWSNSFGRSGENCHQFSSGPSNSGGGGGGPSLPFPAGPSGGVNGDGGSFPSPTGPSTSVRGHERGRGCHGGRCSRGGGGGDVAFNARASEPQ